MTIAYKFEFGSDDNEMTNEQIRALPTCEINIDTLTLMHPDQCELFADNYDTFDFYYPFFDDEVLYIVPKQFAYVCVQECIDEDAIRDEMGMGNMEVINAAIICLTFDLQIAKQRARAAFEHFYENESEDDEFFVSEDELTYTLNEYIRVRIVKREII